MISILFRRAAALFFALILTLCIGCPMALACTIFSIHRGDTVLAGNNEDWLYHYASTGWVVSGDGNSLGRVCFGNIGYVQGGMNEKGLFYDGATCPNTSVPYDPDKETLGINLGEQVLVHCATVDEAVEYLSRFNIPNGYGDHLLFADANGDSVIVEWVDGEMRVIRKEGEYQIATNFFLSVPDKGGFPCTRFDTAEAMLKAGAGITAGYCADILKSTAQHWGDGGTKYSNVYDLKALRVYTYNQGDFSQFALIDLREELAQLRPGARWDFDVGQLAYDTAME